jgi:hypothetical protein
MFDALRCAGLKRAFFYLIQRLWGKDQLIFSNSLQIDAVPNCPAIVQREALKPSDAVYFFGL